MLRHIRRILRTDASADPPRGRAAGLRAALRRSARRLRRRALVPTLRAVDHLGLPRRAVAGGALATAAVAAAFWSVRGPPWADPGAGRGDAPRACSRRPPAELVDPRRALFGGAFADLPPAAEADVRTWTEILSDDHRRHFRTYLTRVARYGSWIRPALARHGVPEDFLWMAVIESGLNPEAHSRMGAVGPWQFVPRTAREEGLRVRWSVDERRDPVAATHAAARYLARLEGAFGSWALAAAAYNAGPRRVGRALRRCGCDTFWELAQTGILARETRHFVPKLIAAARLGSAALRHGLAVVPSPPPASYREVEVEPASRLEAVAEAAGESLDRLRRLNPHLIRGLAPATPPSRVRLPPQSVGRFRSAWRDVPEGARRGGAVHLVRRRETLSEIARDYGVSVRALRAANGRLDPRRLRPGQRLRVPGGGS